MQPSIDYDEIASEYAQHRRVHPGVLKTLVTVGNLSDTSTVLDVGCGTGNYAIALRSLFRCSCLGIDPSQEMLRIARDRTSDVKWQLGKAEQLEFPGDSFDLVFSVDVIHHVSGKAQHFEEAYRVLRRGGLVCTVTDSEWIIRHREPLSVYFPESVDAELKRYPRISDLRTMMTSVSFVHISQSMTEFRYQLEDVQAYRDKAFSALHMIPEEAYRKGINRMEGDLRKGNIDCNSRYLLLRGTK